MSLDALINFGNIVAGSAARPGPINPSFFYARWTGYLVPTVTGAYTIGANVADGVNIFIGDTPLINQLGSSLTASSSVAYSTSASAVIQLTAGVFYPLTVEWQHGTGTSYELQLLWTPPGGSVQVIPSANLSTAKTSVTSNITGTWWNGTAGLWYPNGPGIIDFANANQVNKNQDNVGDGSTFKRVANVNADNTFHLSTSFNAQASILPNQVVLITFTMPSFDVINATWAAQSLARPDASSLSIPASSSLLGTALVTEDAESSTVGSQASGWTLAVGNGLLCANDFVHGGSKSLKIVNPSATDSSSFKVIGGFINGRVYSLRGWIKTTALPTVSSSGAQFHLSVNGGGVTAITLVSVTSGSTFFLTSTDLGLGLSAIGTAWDWTFVELLFKPTGSGSLKLYTELGTNCSGTAWFDDFGIYPTGASWNGLSASTGYYVYSRINASTGNIEFVNGNPPGTSPSDTLAAQCCLDGYISLPSKKITTPASGGSGSDTGGGSGTCPEFDAPVFVRRYSQDSELIFEGEIKAGEVQAGYESEDGAIKRGDFLRGYSFKQRQDVYRAALHVSLVPNAGWMRIDGIRFTACETVWDGPLDGGQWLPAWKVSGAIQDSTVGEKVLIEVEADWDDEHNYFVRTSNAVRLIHNTPVLPC